MVQLIFEKYALGNWSTHSLEQFLWECGYRNYKGGKIDSHVIANIIRNPKYKGYYVGGKVKIVDLFTKKQKFLPEDEWVPMSLQLWMKNCGKMQTGLWKKEVKISS